MIKVFKIAGMLIVIVLVVFLLVVELRQSRSFTAPYPAIEGSSDSSVVARGQQIVFGAGHCASCHGAPETEEQVAMGKIVPLPGGKVFPLPIRQVLHVQSSC